MTEINQADLVVVNHVKVALRLENETFLFVLGIMDLEDIKPWRGQGCPQIGGILNHVDKPAGGAGQKAIFLCLFAYGDYLSPLA